MNKIAGDSAMLQNPFDLAQTHTMCLAFDAIGRIPIKTAEIHVSISNVCTNVNTV
jgi:hypothetical protein